MAQGATSTLIPIFVVQEMRGGVAEVGILASATSLVSVPGFILWGHLSDSSKKRKGFILLGYFGMALSLFLMGIARTLPEFYVANLLFGGLAAASGPVAAVLVLETSRHEEWAERLAEFARLGGIGWVAGLALGVFWLQSSLFGSSSALALRSLFLVGAALALLSGLMAWRWIQEPSEDRRVDRHQLSLVEIPYWVHEHLRYLPSKLLHSLTLRGLESRVAENRPLVRLYLSASLLFIGFTGFYAIFPVYLLLTLGFSSGQVFAAFLSSQAASTITYLFVGRWIKRVGPRPVLLAGTAGRVILFPSLFSVALFGLSPDFRFASVLALHALVGLCWAMINVSGGILVSDLAKEGEKAEAMGVYNAVQGVSAILGPLAFGFLALNLGILPVGLGLGSIFLLAGIFLLLLSGRKVQTPSLA